MEVEELIKPTEYITLVQPIANDGGADHVVCVIHDLIFDTRLDNALKLTKESFEWICGKRGMLRTGPIHRFNLSCHSNLRKKIPPIRRHWYPK
jgi:hypothetical protein